MTDMVSIKTLWQEVLYLGISDAAGGYLALAKLRKHKPDATIDALMNWEQKDGLRWINSNAQAPGSFAWICAIFGWDHDTVRRKLAERWDDMLKPRKTPPQRLAA